MPPGEVDLDLDLDIDLDLDLDLDLVPDGGVLATTGATPGAATEAEGSAGIVPVPVAWVDAAAEPAGEAAPRMVAS